MPDLRLSEIRAMDVYELLALTEQDLDRLATRRRKLHIETRIQHEIALRRSVINRALYMGTRHYFS